MTPDERKLIEGLFERLKAADASGKDSEAMELIRTQVAAFPDAPYLLVQTLLVQEHALANAQAKIAELQRQVSASGQAGSAFLPGGAQQPASTGQPVPSPLPVAQPTYAATANMVPGGGGNFLRTALATAAGVAGGSLLFQGIEGLLRHDAGPFSSGFGDASGFLPTEVIQPTEVTNYFVDDDRNQSPTSDSSDASTFDTASADDSSDLEDGTDYSDDSFDDDSSLV
jgi:uncharacterized protein